MGGLEGLRATPVPYEELNRHVVTAAARSLVSEQQLAVLQVRPQLSMLHLPLCMTSFDRLVICECCTALRIAL